MAILCAFWGIEYTYWKIIAVVKSNMLKGSGFFFGCSIQNYVYFIPLSFLLSFYEFYLEFRYLNFTKLII